MNYKTFIKFQDSCVLGRLLSLRPLLLLGQLAANLLWFLNQELW